MSLGALGIGRREDLFCRQVRHVLDARPRPRAGAFAREARGGEEADRQVRARPLEVQCVEPERVETGAGLVELVGARAPRRGRIVVVQPADVHELLPQLRDGLGLRQVRMNHARPRRRGSRVAFDESALIRTDVRQLGWIEAAELDDLLR